MLPLFCPACADHVTCYLRKGDVIWRNSEKSFTGLINLTHRLSPLFTINYRPFSNSMYLLWSLGYKEILVTLVMQHKAKSTLENQKTYPLINLRLKIIHPNLPPFARTCFYTWKQSCQKYQFWSRHSSWAYLILTACLQGLTIPCFFLWQSISPPQPHPKAAKLKETFLLCSEDAGSWPALVLAPLQFAAKC